VLLGNGLSVAALNSNMETKDRLIHYLSDAHAAEVGLLEVLEDAVELCDGPARAGIKEHLAQTKSQAQRLERRLEQLGADRSGAKGMMNAMLGKIGSMMDIGHDESDRQVQCLIKLYGAEHLEMGMYEALAAYADAVGDVETANLAREIHSEEQAAADKLYQLIAQYAKQVLIEVPAEKRDSYGYPSP
jgi:ferritin-like metal-binding protein YciE